MAYFLATWNILLFTSLASGFYSLKYFRLSANISHIQYDIMRLWFGLAIQCLILLTLGFFIPLNLILLVFIIAIITESLIRSIILPHHIRSEPSFFLAYFADFLRRVGLPLFLAEVVLAILLLRPIVWFDTGLYHLGAARWLAQHGFVPGLALMNAKFGFVSSWFALTASLIPDFIGDHIGPVSNGFLLVISSCTLILLLGEWLKNKTYIFEDFFLATYLLGLTSLYLVSWVIGESILVSLSHDLPVNYMVGIFCWLLLIAANPVGFDAEQNKQTLDIHLVVLNIAAIIVSFKLTGLFLLPIALAVYGLKQPLSIKRWGMGLGITGLTLLPLATAQIITSGCLLYPSQSFCLALPWTLPAQNIAREADYIVSGGFLTSFSKNLLAIPENIWSTWITASNNPKVMFATLLILLSLALIVWRILKCQDRPPGENWIILTGISGSLFIFSINSYVVFRFGGGIILILPVYFMALFIYRFFLNKNRERVFINRQIFSSSSNQSKHPLRVPMSLALLGVIVAMVVVNPSRLINYAILPPPVPQADLLYVKENDIIYTLPKDGYVRCWNAKLPCSPNPLNKIHFRMPQKGLGGGFIHIEEPE